MRAWSRILVVVVISAVSAVSAAGCSGDDAEESTTTSSLDPVTTLAASDVSTPASNSGAATSEAPTGDAGSTTPSTEGLGPPGYEIASRTDGDDGDTVVVLLDPDSYTSLSDIDLQSVIRDVYDKFPPIATVHLVDSDEVVELVLTERVLTDDEMALLDQHYFARLEDGIRIVFLGPFDDYDIAILGS
jgi:hypothetical protein